ncbi:hypothetical protein DLJ53_31525 [Acuticoccus sediminis]|uniref:DUF5666 domain-containing protein n=1 Tax=Acuticoccus sediminis TaxID=2184697 RepID=A0A8B2NKX1_9HYPH|nr:hypothetical protein DLJ53_31525 [Acuticoccus sediminis]
MLRMTLSTLLVAAALGAPVTAMAQSQGEIVRIRGDIVEAADSALTVKTREGETVEVTLADGWKLAGVGKAAVTDIKPGDYVGIASLPKADGGDGALEVVIFPPAMSGVGEGSFGWDLKPNSTMTNATVANAVKGVDGRTVTLTYNGKEKAISIPDGVPVVTLAAATPADLKAGVTVFIAARKDSSGAVSAQRVIVGKNGVVPPM